MTAVRRAAEAPRAASSISSSSIRWCCTGGTSACTMNTSASRQLASSCTPRQSLLKVDVVEGLSGIFRRLQIACASWGWALPLKMTILFMRGEHHTRHFASSKPTQRPTTLITYETTEDTETYDQRRDRKDRRVPIDSMRPAGRAGPGGRVRTSECKPDGFARGLH